MNYPIWLDLNDTGIVPPLGSRRAGEVKSEAIMISTEPDFRFAAKQKEKIRTESFFMSSLLTLTLGKEGCSVAGPFIGAAYGTMLIESLIARGAERIIVFGWCGSISEVLKTGDIIIPDSAIADEGVSRNYLASEQEFPAVSSSENLNAGLCRDFEKSNLPFKKGTIWTTDAIYRETSAKVDFFKRRGAVAVEMECSALFSVAAFRKIEVAAVLVVSDEVNPESWKPGFRAKAFKEARKNALRIILDYHDMRTD